MLIAPILSRTFTTQGFNKQKNNNLSFERKREKSIGERIVNAFSPLSHSQESIKYKVKLESNRKKLEEEGNIPFQENVPLNINGTKIKGKTFINVSEGVLGPTIKVKVLDEMFATVGEAYANTSNLYSGIAKVGYNMRKDIGIPNAKDAAFNALFEYIRANRDDIETAETTVFTDADRDLYRFYTGIGFHAEPNTLPTTKRKLVYKIKY